MVWVEPIAPNSELDSFTATGQRGLFQSQATANARFTGKVQGAIDQINAGLAAKMLNLDSNVSDQAIAAWLRFGNALSKYDIRFKEITDGPGVHAGGGVNRSQTFGLIQWDPSFTSVQNGVSSAPYIILGHEIWHVIDGLEFSPAYNQGMKNLSAGRYTNDFEMSAIAFENLIRNNGDQRTFHDPNNPNF